MWLQPEDIWLTGEHMASGGRYSIFEAEVARTGARVVAKRATRVDAIDPAKIKRDLMAEHEALSRLDHEAIPKSLGLWRDPDTEFVHHIMEYLPGRTLDDWIKVCVSKHMRHGGAIRWSGTTDTDDKDDSVLQEVLSQIMSALSHAHSRGVIHNDIKPTNVVVHYSDDRVRAYLIDFEAAGDDGIRGSLPYCAPERFTDAGGNERTDIYSLGVMLFEALTGQKPWDETNPSLVQSVRENHPVTDLRDDVARQAWNYICDEYQSVANTIADAVHIDPDKRPPNVVDMMRQLNLSLEGPPRRRNQPLLRGAVAALAICIPLLLPTLQPYVARPWLRGANKANPALQSCRASVRSALVQLRAPTDGLPDLDHLDLKGCREYSAVLTRAIR